MLRVSFSPAPECVEVDCWNQAFQTPPCHQDGVIIVIIVVVPALTKRLHRECIFWEAIITTLKYFGLVVVIVVAPVLTKGYIGNACSGRR